MRRKKTYLKTVLVLAIAITFLWANSAQAQLAQVAGGYVAHFGLTAVMSVLTPVAYLIGYVAGQMVFLGGTLTNWALDLNSQLIQNQTVQIGWVVTRDLANLGFVLAIILIAFATILRVETYQMQKILWKLIVAALLINFSLVIAGVFIDFSGILTNFFIQRATNFQPKQLGAGLADAFQVHTILQQKDDAKAIQDMAAGLANDFNKLTTFFASLIFVAIFTALVAMSLLSLAAMLFVRYIILIILLILMPLTWLMWIWPDLEGHWKKWWSEFMRWTFFAPAVTFFIYLALNVATNLSGIRKSGAPIPVEVAGLADLSLFIKDFGSALGQMISVLGILYGGIYAANKMGIAGANVGFVVAKGIKNAAVGGVVGGAMLGGGYLGAGLRDRLRNIGADKEGKGVIERTAAKLTGNPIIGGLARGTVEWTTAGKKEQVGAYEKGFDKLAENKEGFINAAKSPGISNRLLANDAYAAAYMNKAAEKGYLKDLQKTLPADIFGRLLTATKKAGTANKVYAKNPTLAAWGITDKDEARKAVKDAKARVKPSDIANLDASDFYNEQDFNPTLLLNLTKPDIKQLSMAANPKQIEAINKGIAKIETMITANELTLEADEKRGFERLKNWEEDSIGGQIARTETKTIPIYGAGMPVPPPGERKA